MVAGEPFEARLHLDRVPPGPFEVQFAADGYLAPQGLRQPLVGVGDEPASVMPSATLPLVAEPAESPEVRRVVAYLFQQGHLVGWAQTSPRSSRPATRSRPVWRQPRRFRWGRQLGLLRPDPHHHPGGQSPLPRLGVWQPAPGDASPGTGHHRPGAGRMRVPLPTTRCYQWLRPTLVSSG